ncbi:phage head-tail connector protein [Aureimonas glaciei]|uniref:Phage gp6-like head-tail connector protein n=1 Tax=Aureimonas glaciei TaxID=1776957 RepID=A0A916YER9_9HYPH|nr:phage head-tail connector protein [Aureimonas glaciei]GGD42574.1 hypothetical protein GCM10011335_51590 [Aureimonas glaciei]
MLKVVAPASETSLVDLAVVKRALSIADASGDDLLMELISRASSVITTYCRRTFALETVRETFRGNGRGADGLMLARWPVVAVDALTIGSTAADPSSVDIEGTSGIVHRVDSAGRCIGWQGGDIVIEYAAGYVLAPAEARTLPADIEQACILIVSAGYHAQRRDPMLRSEQVEGIGRADYQISGGLPSQVTALLEPYRNVGIG